MAVPKRKTSKQKKRSRRTHKDRIGEVNLTTCANPECGAPVIPHHACPECGTLTRRKHGIVQVIEMVERTEEGS